MINRFHRPASLEPPMTRESSIPLFLRAQTRRLRAWDVTVRLSAVVAGIVTVWMVATHTVPDPVDGALLLPLAGMAGQTTFRYLRVHLD
ncbi:hypothetical protein ACFW9M_19160 [Streptomyces lydicus]|uniref:hypothetical protein n=1 Tax=Streptomyces lydicus TaxID=47763 RepID=UPI0036AC091B